MGFLKKEADFSVYKSTHMVANVMNSFLTETNRGLLIVCTDTKLLY